jgi:branched-chain amino acid transport system ATP-binding protein
VTDLLEVSGLDVAYGKVKVLEAVDFRVGEGEVVALLGTNGAGKSTLLRAISGALPTLRGSIRFAGRDITGAPCAAIVRAGLLQLPGGRATFPGLTVAETLRVGGLCVPKLERGARAEEALARFPSIADRASQLAGTLSGGQQQLLALARVLMARPRVVMIDELSLGLAPAVVAELLDALAALRDEGVAVIIVEQHVDLALDVADRAYFLERGRVRFDGPAADLRGRDDLLRAVFLAGVVPSEVDTGR